MSMVQEAMTKFGKLSTMVKTNTEVVIPSRIRIPTIIKPLTIVQIKTKVTQT